MNFMDEEAGKARCAAGGSSETALSNYDTNTAPTKPEVAADRVVEHWIGAAKSLVLACSYFVAGLNAFEKDPESHNAFLARLIAKGVFSQNDVLARLKANGKLAMLTKIGRHAAALLQPSILCLLPAHYSIIYQICLLIEEVGRERAEAALAGYTDARREDVTKIRAALTPRETDPGLIAPATLDDFATQLFALRLTAQGFRPFAEEYVGAETLGRCFRRPQPADDAGLLAIVPILSLGTLERALMPLLGFDATYGLFLESAVDHPNITSRDLIVVAKRGSFRPQPLTTFPTNLGPPSVLTLADFFFPGCTVKCQPFAQGRTDGWVTLIGDENWNETPSVR